ncbi:MAG: hypothetical protein PHN59_00750 [Candidatus Omnitrophica bacterium]|nr:hypothetical protein [Candidatus Omnitrophota bacterium]
MTRKIKAFTFIELFIVIIIIGIASAVAFPRLKNSFESFELKNFARDIYFLSRYLQDSAISQGKTYYLAINTDNGQLQALTMENAQFKNITGKFAKVHAAPRGIEVSLDPAADQGVYFYPDASTGKAAILFTNQKNDKLSLIFSGVSGGIQVK